MSSEDFVVRISDLDAGPYRLERPISQEWLERALADTEGAVWHPDQPSSGVGDVNLQVTKTGRQILVSGQIHARVILPCARTLDPAYYELTSQVFLMLHPSPEEASERVSHGQSARPRRPEADRGPKSARRDERPGKPGEERRPEKRRNLAGKDAATQKGKRRGDWSDDPELTETDAAADTYSGEELHLDGFIREFIVLEFPMFPLREDLRSDPARASSALPSGAEATGMGASGAEATQQEGDRPLDPRLSPLAELKARLEKKE